MGNFKEIYLAGGCFWGVEKFFKMAPGVIETSVGYANGQTLDTNYYVDKEESHTIKEKIENEQNKYSREIQVEVRPLKHYILAEEYHQNYLDKNPNGYCHIDLESAVKIFGKNKDIRQS